MRVISNRPSALPIINAASLAGKAPPPREWLVPDLIPRRTVTMLGGQGGVGKSLLALQLAASTAIGAPWIGFPIERAPAVYLSAEDDVHELHRRLEDVAASLGCDMGDFGDLDLLPLAEGDAVLAAPGPNSELLGTALLAQIHDEMARRPGGLFVIDTLADTHTGSEIDRGHARQYVGLLRRLSLAYDATVLLLAHPSLTGISSGSGLSGSTAWSASVRSRLYLDHPADAEPAQRLLQVKKSNYSAIADPIPLLWRAGVYVREGAPSMLDAMAASSRVDRVFLDLLAQHAAAGRTISDATGANYAPRLFADNPRSEGISRKGFEAAMNRLFAAGKIRMGEVGPASRRRRRMVAS